MEEEMRQGEAVQASDDGDGGAEGATSPHDA